MKKKIIAIIVAIVLIIPVSRGWYEFLLDYFFDAEFASSTQLKKLNNNIGEYDFVGPFSEGLAMVGKDGKVGFIDRKGKIVIPVNFEMGKYPSVYDSLIFRNGLYVHSNIGVVDKNGNLLLSKDRLGFYHHMYNGTTLIEKSVYDNEKSYVIKDNQIVSEKKGSIVFNVFTKTALTGKDGSYMTTEDLKSMGYSEFDKFYRSSMYSPIFNVDDNNTSYDGFVMYKNGKYGVVDSHGKTILPFEFDSPRIFHFNGLFFFCVGEIRDGEVGYEFYPYWLEVYKEGGTKVLDKISYLYDFGNDFLCVYGLSDKVVTDMKSTFGVDFPQSVKESFIINAEGEKIQRVPYGKNYLRNVGKDDYYTYWMLEDKAGKPVLDFKFSMRHIGNNVYYVYSEALQKSLVLDEKGDTINVSNKDDSKVEDCIANGILSFDELKGPWYSALYGYEKDMYMSKKDKRINRSYTKNFRGKGCHTYFREIADSHIMKRVDITVGKDAYALLNNKGEIVLPYDFDEIGYFSEGLIHVKYHGRWYYTNENGDNLPEEVMKKDSSYRWF